MKIKIVTGAWKRHQLFEFFCRYYADLQKRANFELIIACSEPETLEIAQRYGHTALMVANEPLSRKFNTATERAIGADYCLMIGSDDFVTYDTLKFYQSLFKKGYDYIYPLDWYFYDTASRKGLYWKGYDQPHNIGKGCGAGRALSNALLDKMQWHPWAAGFDRVLDNGMQAKIDALPHSSYCFRLRDYRLFGLDIKTEQNMTPFAKWPNTMLFDGREMLDTYVPEYTNEIMKLR